MSIKNILSSRGMIITSKVLAQKIGLQSAVLFGELLSKEQYFQDREMLTEDGFFYCTIENLEEDTTLKRKVQTNCIKILQDEGLIFYEVKGMPATRYFKCCSEDFLYEYLKTVETTQSVQKEQTSLAPSQFGQKEQTSLVEKDKQVCSKRRLNKNKENKNKENKNKEGDMANGQNTQKTFFNLPEKEVVQSKKKLTQVEQSQERISSAKKTGDWSSVTFSNFTHYYIQKHNEMGYTEIVFNRFEDVSIMRDSFISRYDIPKEQVCQFIDEVLKVYSTHPDRRNYDYLSFNMINKVPKLMQDIMRAVDGRLRPPKKKYMSVTEQRENNGLKTNAEVDPNDLF